MKKAEATRLTLLRKAFELVYVHEIAMSCQKSEIGGAAQATRRTAHKLSMNKG